jgi:hypothetical protein
MADLTKTVSVQLGIVGSGQPQYWGTMVWGTNEWGSESLYLTIAKGIANDLEISTAIGKDVLKLIQNDLDISTAQIKDFTKGITSDLTFSSQMESIYLLNGIYYYVWPGGVTNFLDRTTPIYNSAATSTSWTAATRPTTTWSAV